MTQPGEFIECQGCGVIFAPRWKGQRFHSRSCARAFEQRLRDTKPSAVESLMLAIRTEFEKVVKK